MTETRNLSLSQHAFFSNPSKKDEFLFGTSTAAYQIEGGFDEDGKGKSIWDEFTHRKGIANGDVACDDFHRVKETIEALKLLGVDTYRFSIAWTRIQPDGVGEVNQKGIAYYHYLINELCKVNIQPMVTIYHWDLPQSLEDQGGWTNRDIVAKYVAYARILFQAYGPQVRYWITHNEPRVTSTRGYGTKDMAPGRNDPSLIPIVNHHLLLSHGLAVKAFRELGLPGEIGISLNLKPVYCLEPSQRKTADEIDLQKNRMYLEPILCGKYPRLNDNSFIQDGDMEIIAQPIDFLGINNYTSEVVPAESILSAKENCLGWKTYPQGIYDLLVNLKQNYPSVPPIFITENGFADHAANESPSRIQDDERIDYLKDHIQAVFKAKEAGVPIKGYIVWSLLDNLEWSFGYSPRFGLIHVNFSTLERTPKKSFYEYQKLIKARCLPSGPSLSELADRVQGPSPRFNK